jgi:cytochrome c553
MRVLSLIIGMLLLVSAVMAQDSGTAQPVGNMSDIMVSIIYPAANEILTFANRAPADDKEWIALQRSAVRLGESGNLLMMRGHALNQGDWIKDAKLLVDVGAAAYKAAKAKDAGALPALNDQINASCTTCHKQYRPNVYPNK